MGFMGNGRWGVLGIGLHHGGRKRDVQLPVHIVGVHRTDEVKEGLLTLGKVLLLVSHNEERWK